MIEVPAGKWLKIEDVWKVLESAGILPKIFGDNGGFTREGFLAGGRWICEAAFSGDIQLKGCRAEPHGDGLGEPIDIPSEYFRRPRAVYGSGGISRLSWSETDEELRRDEINQRAGAPEPDWDDVLILQESFVAALQKMVPVKSGDAGRPSSKELYVEEFNRRSQAGEICSTLTAESEYLSDWLKSKYPLQPQATAKTIANRIRPLFWQSVQKRA